MRPVTALELPAGTTVELRPGSYHVMLIDLRKPLQPGDTVPITLTLEARDGKRSSLEVQAAVRPLNTPANGADAGAAHMGHSAR